MKFHFCDQICQNNLQCFCLIFAGAYGRKSIQCIFSRCDFMAYVNQITALGTVPVLDIYSIITEITGAKGGIFLRQSVQRISSVAAC